MGAPSGIGTISTGPSDLAVDFLNFFSAALITLVGIEEEG